MYKHVRLLTILSFISSLSSSLYPNTPIDLVAMKSDQKQLLFGLYIYHNLLNDEKNAAYVKKLMEIFEQNEKEGNIYFHILIEHFPQFYQKKEGEANVLEDLFPLIEGHFKKTCIKNVEIRKLSGAALDMLRDNYDPFNYILALTSKDPTYDEFKKRSFEYYGCRMDIITFEQVIKECTQLLAKARQLTVEDELIQREFERICQVIEDEIRDFRNDLKRYSIDPNQFVLETSNHLWEYPTTLRPKRARLHSCLLAITSHLFNLFTVDRVLKLKSQPWKTVLFMSGGGHVEEVTRILSFTKNFHELHDLNNREYKPERPLKVAALDLLKRPIEYFEQSFLTLICSSIKECFQ